MTTLDHTHLSVPMSYSATASILLNVKLNRRAPKAAAKPSRLERLNTRAAANAQDFARLAEENTLRLAGKRAL